MTKDNTMRVGFVEKADAFVIKQVDRPVVSKQSVLIKVHIVGVNFADAMHIKGSSPLKPPTGIVGTEYSGEVVQVGEEVTNYQVGDRVLALCGGALAEYAVIEANDRRAAKIPEGVSYEKAAALGIQGLTAITLVNEGYQVKKGDFVCLNAAGGGVGSLLIQSIRHQGGIVIASTSSDEKAELCKKLGADYVINYKKEDILQRVLEITQGEGVHVALDSVGRTTFNTSIASLRPFGVVILYGWASGPVENWNPGQLMAKNLRVQGSSLWTNMPTKEQAEVYFKKLFDLYQDKVLDAHIHKIYPFKNALQAYTDIISGTTSGKLLIQI